MQPRYPEIRVTVHSRNPCALIGAVRMALRQAGVDRDEIRAFSSEAFESPSADRVRRVCDRWATVDLSD
jgi:hypothetical protein